LKSRLDLRPQILGALPGMACMAVLLFGFQGLLAATIVIILELVIATQLSTTITRKPPISIHSVAVGFGIFVSVSSLSVIPLQFLGVAGLAWYVLPVLGIFLGISRKSQWRLAQEEFRIHWQPWLIAAISLLLLSLLNRAQFLKYGPPWSLNPYVSHFDTTGLQFIANASVSEGVGSNGFMADWPLNYHWLAFAWSGEIERYFQLEPFTALLVLLPWLSLFGLVVTVTSLVSLMTTILWVRSIAPFTTLTGLLPGSYASVNINWDSVSQMASGALLISALLLVLHLRRTKEITWKALLFLGLISCALIGYKVSASLVFIAAIAGIFLFHPTVRSRARGLGFLPAAAILVGSAIGYLIFIHGVSSSADLRLRDWVSATSRDTADLGAIIILLSAAFIALPLIFGRSGITTDSRDGVNAGSAALLASLIPIVVLEHTPPNSTWFFATACLLAIPASFVLADSYYRKFTDSPALPAVSISLFGALAWVATSATQWSMPLRQIVVLAAIWIGAVTIILFQQRRTIRQASALALLAGVLVVAWITPVELLTSRLIQMNEADAVNSASQDRTDEEFSDPGSREPSDGIGPILETSSLPVEEGRLVIVPPEIGMDGLTWAALNRLRVYSSYKSYAINTGPPGTEAEFERRSETANTWLSTQALASLKALCAEGVEAVVAPSSSSELPTVDSPDAFMLMRLPCETVK